MDIAAFFQVIYLRFLKITTILIKVNSGYTHVIDEFCPPV